MQTSNALFTLVAIVGVLCFNTDDASLNAQITVMGTVREVENKEPIEGVIVVSGSGETTMTREDGTYELVTKSPEGKLTLTTQSLVFLPKSVNVDVASARAITQDFELEEWLLDLPEILVRSASVTGGRGGISGIPGTAHYISPKEIERFNHTDVHRMLSSIPGVQIQEEDGFGLRPNIGLRGTGVERSSKITLMEDGVLISPAPYSAPAAYFFPTIARMQGVEVMKGSSQVKYGPQTTGGVLNLISAQIPSEFGGQIMLRGGSFANRDFQGLIGSDSKFVGFVVQGLQQASYGFKSLPTDDDTGFRKEDYMAKLRIHSANGAKRPQSLTLKAGYVKEISNETYLGLARMDFNDDAYQRYAGSQKDQMKADQYQLSAQYVLQVNSNLHFTITGYRNVFSRNWYKLDAVTDALGEKLEIGNILDDPGNHREVFDYLTGENTQGDASLVVKANNRDYFSHGIQGKAVWSPRIGQWSHHFELGMRVHQDEMDRFQWVDNYTMSDGAMVRSLKGVAGTESNLVESAGAQSAYFHYELSRGRWSVSPGIRLENVIQKRNDYGKNDVERSGILLNQRENQYASWIPGIGLEYAWHRGWNFFGGIHKGFSPSGSKENVSPEESINYEVGARYSKSSWSGTLVVFFSDYQNLLGSDLTAAGGTGSVDLFNGGAAVNRGIELEASYVLSSDDTDWKWPMKLSYTYSDAFFKSDFDSDFGGWGTVDDGDQLPYMAPHRISYSISAEHPKWQFNLNAVWVAEMLTKAARRNENSVDRIGSYGLIDVSIHHHFNRHLSISGNINNVLNNEYEVANRPAGWRPGLPRTFMIGVEGSF